MTTEPVHRTIVAMDIERFNRPEFDDEIRTSLISGLRGALATAFVTASITEDQAVVSSTGDGFLVLLSPEVHKTRVLRGFLDGLADGLCGYNRLASQSAQLRLRIAVHAGEVVVQGTSAVGKQLNLTFRLLNCDEVRARLKREEAPAVAVISELLYEQVVEQHLRTDASRYERIDVREKETATRAWVRGVDGRSQQVRVAEPPQSLPLPQHAPGTPGPAGGTAAPARGGRVAHHDERRLVTVLAASADITLPGQDPEDARSRYQALKALIGREAQRFGGMVTDGAAGVVTVAFGAPRAHEDDPERAVRAALAINAAVDDQQLRIGIDSGQTIVSLPSGLAGPPVLDGPLVGRVLMLQALAPNGQILVGDAVYRATQASIDYEAYPWASAWRTIGARARLGYAAALVPTVDLVAREHELGLLRGMLDRCRREAEPQFITIVGAPGIGKTRLVYDLGRIVEADPALITWRQGRASPYDDATAGVSVLAEILKAHAGIVETHPSDQIERRLHLSVGDLLGGSTAGWVMARLRVLVGLLDEKPGEPGQAELFAAYQRFLEALASQRPLVLVFEDLHWGDAALLDFVESLVDLIAEVPLLIVCTARPELLERRPGWGGGKRNSTTLSLPMLSHAATETLLRVHLGTLELPGDTRTALLNQAGGNPLFVEPYVRMMRDRGMPAAGGFPMPDSIQRLIAARLDDLPADDKAILIDAAVLVEAGWVGALAAMGGRGQAVVRMALRRLERRELLRRVPHSSVAGEVEYAFRHVLVRDVAYEQLPRAERVQRHLRAAAWLASLPTDPVEARAHHHLQALRYAQALGQPAEVLVRQARLALRAAGDRAASLGAWAAAAHHYAVAAELWPEDSPEWPDLLFRAARARGVADGGSHGLFDQAREALLAAGEQGRAAEMEMRNARLAWLRGQRGPFEVYNRRAFAMVAGLPASAAKVYVVRSYAFNQFGLGQVEEARRTAAEALRMAETLGLEEDRGQVLGTIGLIRVTHGELGGVEDLEQGVAILREVAPVTAATWLINLANGRGRAGDLDGALAAHVEAAQLARRFSLHNLGAWTEGILPRRSYWTGRWDEGVRLAEAFLADPDKAALQIANTCRLVRGQIRLGRGDLAGALADAEGSVAGARRMGGAHEFGPALGFYARVLLVAGRAGEAAVVAEELLAHLGGGTLEPFVGADLPVVLDGLGWGVDRLEGVFGSPWLDAATAFLGGDLAEAARRYGAMGARPAEAYARLRAAARLAAEGRRAAASTELAAARGFFVRAGASAWAREAAAIQAELDRR